MTVQSKIRLADYAPTPFAIERTELDFDLYSTKTRVKSRLAMKRTGAADATLVLDGFKLKLIDVKVDGQTLDPSAYEVTDKALRLTNVPDTFVLEIETEIDPQNNTALQGLYMSGGRFCTQCEAEGFRRITYYYDRPDVLSRFRVRVAAEKAAFPTLLSNGNVIERDDLSNGRHFVEFEDPFPKPCYLFCLVAGEFESISDSFTTMSGKEVKLFIHVDPGDGQRAHFAMDALKRSMKWDEEKFQREYDLSVYHIVAVRDYNFGAMENKGLNVFNSSMLLADYQSATDDDFYNVERVIAHEYFHNWTGNRITLRDWFQLCLKEGLTVYRDQEFSADMHSRPVQRIRDISNLRSNQYIEDAGPMAHPVRLSEYETIENFYTSTIYRKGAEINRVLREILGEELFAAGIQCYFELYDGKAITLENYVSAFEEVAGRKLDDFFKWYGQAGTPQLYVRGSYDEEQREYALTIEQRTSPTPGQPDKSPLPIPLRIGLIARDDGTPLECRLQGENAARSEHKPVLETESQTFIFENVATAPIPAVLRGFNAPVIIHDKLSADERLVQMANDPDPFTRWDAGQSLLRDAIMVVADGNDGEELTVRIANTLRLEMERAHEDRQFAAQTLRVPSIGDLMLPLDEADPEALYQARNSVRQRILKTLEPQLGEIIEAPAPKAEDRSAEAIAKRSLRAAALSLFGVGGKAKADMLLREFQNAGNMTETTAAIHPLAEIGGPAFDEALEAFYMRWKDSPLVLDKWFAFQAGSPLPNSSERIRKLAAHPLFTFGNPNRARSVFGTFGQANLRCFHAADASGYQLLADAALSADKLNPMLSSRFLRAYESFAQLEPKRREAVRAVLKELMANDNLSPNFKEVVNKMLAP